MSISDIFQIGVKSLLANRSLIEVISHNIANANTPGYVRQEGVLTTEIPQRIAGKLFGRGVKLEEVRTIQNSLLDFQIFLTTQKVNQFKAELAGTKQIDNAMAETGASLTDAISEFFNSLQDLASVPEGMPQRTAVLSKAENLALVFHQLSSQLSEIRENANKEVVESVKQVNVILKQIAELNQKIFQFKSQGINPADYLTKRYQLLDELSQYIDFKYFESEEGMVNIFSCGLMILEGQNTASFRTEADVSNDGMSKIILTTISGQDVDITNRIKSGEIKGALMVRDEHAKSALDALDALAYQIVSDFNAIHANGYGLDGNTGYLFFEPLTEVKNAASKITLSSDVNDPAHIAAAQEPAPGDNRNALALAALINTNTMNGGTATYQEFLSSLITKVGSAKSTAEWSYDVQQSILEQTIAQRESISGVSIEEELTKLVQFQQSLEAASKVIEAASKIFDIIISLAG